MVLLLVNSHRVIVIEVERNINKQMITEKKMEYKLRTKPREREIDSKRERERESESERERETMKVYKANSVITHRVERCMYM